MTIKLPLVTALLAVCSTPGWAQLSGYTSVGYGYHQNPLYNYEKLSDQTKQSYIEVSYDTEVRSSIFGLRYVGGLMAFNRFADRNFYEHCLSATYSVRFERTSSDSAQQDEETNEESDDEPADTSAVQGETSEHDSTDNYMSFALKIAARHDKVTHIEFDNQGSELSAAYRCILGQHTYTRFTNRLGLRRYTQVSELSNLSDQLSGEIGLRSDRGLTYGLTGSVGMKYYTSSVYDTTQYESARTFVVNPAGKGKPGGKQISGKTILVQPQANGTVQVTGALYVRKDWSSQSTLISSILYRWTARSATRYLAQRASASTMTEDIYNDFFSYQGPELRLRIVQPLPGGIQVILEADAQSKRFAAPALTLDGVEKGDSRKDLRVSCEVYASRFVQLRNDFGFELSLSTAIARNQSTDSYNDYSLQAVSVGLGISF